MSDGDALLAAVKATPDDDTPRLVYADWLDDCGEGDRAAFIRVQVELARVRPIDLGDVTLNYLPAPDAPAVVLLPLSLAGKLRPGQWARMHAAIPGGRWTFDGQLLSAAVANVSEGTAALTVVVAEHPHADREAELTRQSDALAAEHADSWVPPPLVGQARWGWERGFVEHVRGIDAADWLAHADAILAAHPVRAVTLTTMPEFERVEPGKFRIAGDAAGVVLQNTIERNELGMIEDRWPGIAFELPPAVITRESYLPGVYVPPRGDRGERAYAGYMAAARDEILESIRRAYLPNPGAASWEVAPQPDPVGDLRSWREVMELGRNPSDPARPLDPTAP